MNLNNFSIPFKNYVLLVVTFLSLIQYSEQLYEDQIGKFDWYVLLKSTLMFPNKKTTSLFIQKGNMILSEN